MSSFSGRYSGLQLPTPCTRRLLHHDPVVVSWDIPTREVLMTIPDMTVAIKTDIVTMTGVHSVEMNRFDAAYQHSYWNSQNPPRDCHKRALTQYVRYLSRCWADTGVNANVVPGRRPQMPLSRAMLNVHAGPVAPDHPLSTQPPNPGGPPFSGIPAPMARPPPIVGSPFSIPLAQFLSQGTGQARRPIFTHQAPTPPLVNLGGINNSHSHTHQCSASTAGTGSPSRGTASSRKFHRKWHTK